MNNQDSHYERGTKGEQVKQNGSFQAPDFVDDRQSFTPRS
jgi:hypothetical protein